MTDGGWVRNFPLGDALDRPEVELVVAFRYVPRYPHLGVESLVRLRRRLHPFRAAPPVRAFIAELDEAEAREQRGEPIHLGDMLVRLMRVAIQRNTALEERLVAEREHAIQEVDALRADLVKIAQENARPGRRGRAARAVEERFAAHRATEKRSADHGARVGRSGEPRAELPGAAGVDRGTRSER